GSGKSTLAFDTLYAEGQRRYIEALSTYAKQFLERMPQPLVDAIEGIAPAVAIEQKNPTTSSRSTVGTATEIYDFLRLLWARVGTQSCVKCGHEVKVDTVQEVVDALIADCGMRNADLHDRVPDDQSAIRNPQSAIAVTFPLPQSAHRPEVDVAAQLRAAGFVRAQLDGAVVRLDGPDVERRVREAGEVLVVVDRLPAQRPRPVPPPGRRRARPLDQAPLRGPAPHPARGGARQRDPVRRPVARPARARPALPAARRARALPRHVSVPRATRSEALQAVHPRLPAAVPARQDLPGVWWRAAQAGGVGGQGGRPDDRRRRRADGRCHPRLDQRPYAHAVPVADGTGRQPGDGGD